MIFLRDQDMAASLLRIKKGDKIQSNALKLGIGLRITRRSTWTQTWIDKD